MLFFRELHIRLRYLSMFTNLLLCDVELVILNILMIRVLQCPLYLQICRQLQTMLVNQNNWQMQLVKVCLVQIVRVHDETYLLPYMYPATADNCTKLEQYRLYVYKSSMFNTCGHQHIPITEGPPNKSCCKR